jgi:hypothetical protein
VRRRDFITLLGGAAAAWPHAARAQQPGRLPTIGSGSGTATGQRTWVAAFVQRLRELGWIEGRTVTIEYRWGEGRAERFTEIAAELVRLNVDLILAGPDRPLSGKPDIGADIAARPSLTPKRSQAGLKPCSAAVSCLMEVCYPFGWRRPTEGVTGLGAADCSREPNGARAEAKWTSDNGCVASACSPTSRRFATTASTSMSWPV